VRILTSLLLAFAALTLGPAEAAPAPPAPDRVVAVGDLHGDYQAYLDIVEAAGIADAGGHWTGGHATFVQLGDVPDRGPGTLKIVESLQRLEKAAADAGGKVVVLVGNHEAMNMTGDLRYTTPAEFDAFRTRDSESLRQRVFERNKASILAFYRQQDPEISEGAARERWFAAWPLGRIEHQLAWGPSGRIGQWVAGHPAIVKIGGTLFVHGGISVETAAKPIAEVNAEVRAALLKGESGGPSILTDELGPLWYRGNVERAPAAEGDAAPAAPRPSIDDELTQVLAAYGADRLVVGHTPDLNGIEASHGGRLIRVDTGITAEYGGPHSYLEILGDRTVAWDRNAGGHWVSRALPSPEQSAASRGEGQ
jgi:hypothetical protein